MNGIDIFIVCVFTYNIIIGLTSGFLRSLFGVGAFILATALAPVFQTFSTSIINNYFSGEQELTKIVGLGFSWLFVYISLNIIFNIIIKTSDKTPLKIFDRAGGLFLGLFMSLVIVLTPLLIVKSIPVITRIPQVRTSLEKSVLLPKLSPLGIPFQNFFRKALKEQREELMRSLTNSKNNSNNSNSEQNKEEQIKELMEKYDIKPLGSSR